jgi:hypothetical protein
VIDEATACPTGALTFGPTCQVLETSGRLTNPSPSANVTRRAPRILGESVAAGLGDFIPPMHGPVTFALILGAVMPTNDSGELRPDIQFRFACSLAGAPVHRGCSNALKCRRVGPADACGRSPATSRAARAGSVSCTSSPLPGYERVGQFERVWGSVVITEALPNH